MTNACFFPRTVPKLVVESFKKGIINTMTQIALCLTFMYFLEFSINPVYGGSTVQLKVGKQQIAEPKHRNGEKWLLN